MFLFQEISLIKAQLKESKAKVKRNKTVITGDMKGLEDALLSVDVPDEKNKKGKKNINIAKPKAIQRESIRNKQAYVLHFSFLTNICLN